ncbi:uroporphyrinogen decarboxylase [Shewanella rhizosphaerae]|uniref:uroporphyrinogen decarboxylase n=1 Tax=Shewanella rhizosphaerae TaxID=2864207 RepID=UPI001C65C3C3|nr:uroporphyrinogen decarboxylase [Shewanella rhizosphaerae]QYK12407.1 uroporphyrinogen decarboxylase [Shewanella rhizosphaerae]
MLSPEMLGYLASFFVGISLLMSDIKKLRYINFVGCVGFVVYGFSIAAWPVVWMNGFGALVNVYHLVRLNKDVEIKT